MLYFILLMFFVHLSASLVDTSTDFLKGLSQCNAKELYKGTKIIGGQTAKPLEFPWQSSLQVKYLSSHICGASLISDQWVLTAAHCLRRSSSPTNWKVKLGEHNLNKLDKSEREFNISRVFIHENYSNTNQINDITLLKLKEKVDFNGKDSHLKPICLAPKSLNVKSGISCVATGWGKSNNAEKLSNMLQKVSQPIVDNKSCKKGWPGVEWPIAESNICAGLLEEERGVCTGDSGGPLQCMTSDGQWIQVGIASWTSNPCASKGYPSVFTRVSYYYDWITNKILNN